MIRDGEESTNCHDVSITVKDQINDGVSNFSIINEFEGDLNDLESNRNEMKMAVGADLSVDNENDKQALNDDMVKVDVNKMSVELKDDLDVVNLDQVPKDSNDPLKNVRGDDIKEISDVDSVQKDLTIGQDKNTVKGTNTMLCSKLLEKNVIREGNKCSESNKSCFNNLRLKSKQDDNETATSLNEEISNAHEQCGDVADVDKVSLIIIEDAPHNDTDNTIENKEVIDEIVSDDDGNGNQDFQAIKKASEIDIEITLHIDDSSPEDEEVKTIMESCEELEHNLKVIKPKRMRKLRDKRKYEEINHRKRSKSVDNGQVKLSKNFDFTKYGISIGSGIPHDLLPGIEDYLCNVLANENLSDYAEEQRQYYLERLDIIKLPPSIPPRPQSLGVRLYPLHSSPPLSNRDSVPSLEQDDFAAYQRELSRALVDPDSSSNLTDVKVYDDIDTADSSVFEISPCKTDDEESMYEIPQRNRSDSGYEKALELSPLSKSSSSHEQLFSSCNTGTPIPPPLPPRGERTGSDAASRSSIGSMLDYQAPEPSVNKTKLHRESSVPIRLTKSIGTRHERSAEDLLNHEYYDGASCESLDEVDMFNNDLSQSRPVLPRPMKRKHRSNHRKLGKSMSSLWEVTQPFSMLEDVVISGELHYKSKLTWTRKIVALTMGRLVCYKIDKTDSRPSFVILLSGYKATSHKREGRRSFEIHLDHENFESHVFLVDFKEWAETWCEHINAASKGLRASGPNVHLARGSLMANQDCTYQIVNSNSQLSNSNTSLVSYDGLDNEPGTVKVKKRDQSGSKSAKMGAFALRASQFFESFSKKSSIKKSGGTTPDSTLPSETARRSSGSQSSSCDVLDRLVPLTPDIVEDSQENPVEVKKHIKHQGFLDIYSSFNKRKWGKRWCLIHENNFECYRTQQSDVCELEFLLKNCVLRRAIEETKSELGLMLLENNREKITIEPISWNELGSWLRILMKETSTSVTPAGLEGYMDDTHPYHEAVEITRLQEHVPKTLSLNTNLNSKVGMSDNCSESRTSEGSRDSGIGSSGFSDDIFNYQDRKSVSPQTHVCYTDSSLPRVSVCSTGAIYTQVRKTSVTGSKTKTDNSPQTVDQSTGRINSSNNPGGKGDSSFTDTGNEKLLFDFENPHFEREESLVDEIMSHLNTRLSSSTSPSFETECEESSQTNVKRSSNEFLPDEQTLSPIKSGDNTLTDIDSVFLCSTFADDSSKVQTHVDATVIVKDHNTMDYEVEKPRQSNITEKINKSAATVRRHPSLVSRPDVNVDDTLMELRTRLVQLKKDRISIRDRKQQTISETDKDFLEAEYERLNRECKKVTDEIGVLELNSSNPDKLSIDVDISSSDTDNLTSDVEKPSSDHVKLSSDPDKSSSDINKSACDLNKPSADCTHSCGELDNDLIQNENTDYRMNGSVNVNVDKIIPTESKSDNTMDNEANNDIVLPGVPTEKLSDKNNGKIDEHSCDMESINVDKSSAITKDLILEDFHNEMHSLYKDNFNCSEKETKCGCDENDIRCVMQKSLTDSRTGTKSNKNDEAGDINDLNAVESRVEKDTDKKAENSVKRSSVTQSDIECVDQAMVRDQKEENYNTHTNCEYTEENDLIQDKVVDNAVQSELENDSSSSVNGFDSEKT